MGEEKGLSQRIIQTCICKAERKGENIRWWYTCKYKWRIQRGRGEDDEMVVLRIRACMTPLMPTKKESNIPRLRSTCWNRLLRWHSGSQADHMHHHYFITHLQLTCMPFIIFSLSLSLSQAGDWTGWEESNTSNDLKKSFGTDPSIYTSPMQRRSNLCVNALIFIVESN